MPLELHHFAFFLGKRISTPFNDGLLVAIDHDSGRLKIRQVDVGINEWFLPPNTAKPYVKPVAWITEDEQKELHHQIFLLIRKGISIDAIRAHEIIWLLQHDYDALRWLKTKQALLLNNSNSI